MTGTTLGSYVEIVKQVVLQWNPENCPQLDQPQWASDVISYLSIALTVFYVYVLLATYFSTTASSGKSFYRCAYMLSIGDLCIILLAIRDGVLRKCVIYKNPPLTLAHLALTTLGVHVTVTVNMTFAAMRLAAVFWNFEKADRVANIGLIFSFIWTSIHVLAAHFGYANAIGFDENGEFYDRALFPFDITRNKVPFYMVALSFIIYIITLVKLRMSSRHSMSKSRFSREMIFLSQSLIIFLKQLIYLAFIYRYIVDFGLLTQVQNSNIVYFVRPITAGITPFLYIGFSTNIRKAVFRPFLNTGTYSVTQIQQTSTSRNNAIQSIKIRTVN